MIDNIKISELRKIQRIGYYFRYPLHRKDFHDFKMSGRIHGHYAAKPLYGRLTESGHVDQAGLMEK